MPTYDVNDNTTAHCQEIYVFVFGLMNTSQNVTSRENLHEVYRPFPSFLFLCVKTSLRSILFI